MTRSEFKPAFKRMVRQLAERERAVRLGKKPEAYYRRKHQEFVELIDSAILSGWFVMPGKDTRLYKIYYDVWK